MVELVWGPLSVVYTWLLPVFPRSREEREETSFLLTFFFFFWLLPWYAKVPGPGIKPTPWLNLLSHQGTPFMTLTRSLIQCVRTPPLWLTSSHPNYLPKASPPNTITLGRKVSTYEFVGEGGCKYWLCGNCLWSVGLFENSVGIKVNSSQTENHAHGFSWQCRWILSDREHESFKDKIPFVFLLLFFFLSF